MIEPSDNHGRRPKSRFGKGEFARAMRRHFNDDDCYAITRRFAKELHTRFRVSGPSFNPADFAKCLGIEWEMRDDIAAEGVLTTGAALHSSPLPGQAGFIEGAYVAQPESGPLILLRRLNGQGPCALGRLNFTFAHEIGHFVLRQALASPSVFRFDDPEEEILCNVFAGELLMPAHLIEEDLDGGINPDRMLLLKERYGVSLQAFLTRVAAIYRNNFVGVMWVKDSGHPMRAMWATSKNYTNMLLCDAGVTPVEQAFGSDELYVGPCKILLNGRRLLWNVSAHRLPQSGSNKVLSIFTRESEEAPVG